MVEDSYIDFCGKRFYIEMDTELGDLTELWAYGNSVRFKRGLEALDIEDYLRSEGACQVIMTSERSRVKKTRYRVEALNIRHFVLVSDKEGDELTVLKRSRNKHGDVWACRSIMRHAALELLN